MDVTHIPEFGKLAYVHVTVDTYSHFIYASTRTGEAVKDVIQHLIQCFLFMGKPLKIKTDNAPAYTSCSFSSFLATWEILHTTGIPYNPQGQAIIERTHQLLRTQLAHLRAAHSYFTPHHLLTHALFVLNHLSADSDGLTTASKHWGGIQSKLLPLVRWKDLLTGTWKGPDPLITSGRGYACIFPQDADSPVWIPDLLIRLAPSPDSPSAPPVT